MLASLLLVLAALSLAKSHTKVLVSQNNTICPENCTTFSDLLDHPDDYFTSNTVVEFQPGEYNTEIYGANSTISIVGVSNLTITSNGLELCTIKCSTGYSITFAMYNCTNITLSEIALNGCMHISKFPKTPKLCPFPHGCNTRRVYYSTIIIEYTTNITLYNMRFVNNLSTGTGLSIIDTMGHLRQTQFLNSFLTILQLSNASGPNAIFFQFRNASFTHTESVKYLNFVIYIFIQSLIKVEMSITFSTFSGYKYDVRDAINFIKTNVCTPVLMNIQNSSGISLNMDMAQCNPCRENNDHSITKSLSLKSCGHSGMVKLSGLDIVTVENVTINKIQNHHF